MNGYQFPDLSKIAWLAKLLDELIRGKFTGNVQINFFRGGISNITKTESIKAPDSTTT